MLFFCCDLILQEAGIDARFSEIGASIQETIEPGAPKGFQRWDNGKDTEKPWKTVESVLDVIVYPTFSCLWKWKNSWFYLDGRQWIDDCY